MPTCPHLYNLINVILEYQEYLSRLPEAAHPLLKKEIDWDNKINRDLNEIADSMETDWEVDLSVPLELTQGEINDLKKEYLYEKPALLRYALIFLDQNFVALSYYYWSTLFALCT